jgi:hypothetical protein
MTPADLEKGNGHDQIVEETCELQDSVNSTTEDSTQKRNFSNRLPKPLQRIFLWTKGPSSKREHSIKPFFPSVQRAPIEILDKLCRTVRWKIIAFLSVFLLWLFLFAFLVRRNESPPQVEGFGTPKRLSCAASLW